MNIYWILLISVSVFIAWVACYILFKKYKEIFNPPAFTLYYGIVTSLVISFINALVAGVNIDELMYVQTINFGFYIFYAIGAMGRINLFESMLLNLASHTASGIKDYEYIKKSEALFLILMLTSYIGLIATKSSEWITNPRLAYMDRSGSGVFWAFFSTSIPLLMITKLWVRIKKTTDLILFYYGVIFSILGYFTGSKQTILGALLVLLFYRHVYIKRISNLGIILAAIITVAVFSLVTLLQGSYSEIFSFINYFDMMSNTIDAVSVAENNIQYGAVLISSFWAYVPRAIFPEKPFEYGAILVNSVIYPGAAEDGYTPALLPWFQYYFDFGIIGVIIFGYISGIINATLYKAFLKRRESIFLFAVNVGSSFMIFNTPSYLIGFILCLVVMLKIRVFKKQIDKKIAPKKQLGN